MVLSIKHPTTSELIKTVKSFASFSGLFSYTSKAKVDSVLFKLHCVVTVFILLSGTMFLTMKQYFGDSIECMSGKSDVPTAMIQRYCWMEGSFSAFSRTHEHEGYPGIKTPHPSDRIVYHKYYQWVYFVLIIQSMLFYVPRYIWKTIEGDKLRDLITELRDNHISSLHKFDKYRLLQDVADSMYVGNNYCLYFILCEVLCFVHLFAQIWFTNMFLGGEFWTLGADWYTYANSDFSHKYDPLIKIFPRFVKCTFHKFGPSGTLETLDSMCFLLMNIVNEKIYVTLWFWFFFLLCFTALVLVFRMVYTVSYFRYRLLLRKSSTSNKITLRRLCSSPGNWFVLYFIAKNIKPSYFVDMFDDLLETHFDKRGHRLESTKFKDEVEKGNEAVIKPKKSKSKSKSKSSKTIGFKTDDPSWDSKNEPTTNDDWDNGATGNTSNTNDGWDNDTSNKQDDWSASAPATEDWSDPPQVDWPNPADNN